MEKLKYALGWLFAHLFPQKVKQISKQFTLPQYSGNHFIERGIRYYLGQKIKQKNGDKVQLEGMHKDFWRQSDHYFSDTANRTDSIFIPAYKDLVQELLPLLKEKNIRGVYEFGTGDGKWLNYLSEQWDFIQHFTGIDISEHQIAVNKTSYRHKQQLSFTNSELVEWAQNNAVANGLYHSNGGVLEYLSEQSVRELLQILKHQAPNSLLLFIEPLYGDFDIQSNTRSQIIGAEFSYSHNYPHLIETSGIEMIQHQEQDVAGNRMLISLAYIASNDK